MEYEAVSIPHKPESVTSTSSDQPPSLYSGSSVGDADSPMLQEPGPFEEFQYNMGPDPNMAIQIPFDPDTSDNWLLNEHDQKTFSEFLNAFTAEDKQTATPKLDHETKINAPSHVTIPVALPSPKPLYLDQQDPMPNGRKRKSSASCDASQPQPPKEKQSSSSTTPAKRCRANRELLTEEEKRANHIASEQKRRNTIRNGFKEMTDVVPTLKNINHSKSTILFKAVEYIKHLDRRNRSLREKIASLQMRVEVKRRMGTLASPIPTPSAAWLSSRRNTFTVAPSYAHDYALPPPSRRTSDVLSTRLPPSAMAALVAHKNQQKQLEMLQEQLRIQRDLLSKHNNMMQSSPSSSAAISIPSSSSSTPDRASSQADTSSLFSRLHWTPTYHSISIPNSAADEHGVPYPHSQHSNHSSTVNTNGISTTTTTSYTPALVVPMTAEDDQHRRPWEDSAKSAPSLNIPADDDFGKESAHREGLLSCAKFKQLKQQ